MRWVRAFFGWYVRSCGLWLASGGRASPRDLDRVAWLTGMTIFLNVATRIMPRNSGAHRHGRVPRRGRCHRQLIGSRLRALVRGRTFGARLYAILCVMRDMEAHTRKLMRRLRNGLTRLRVIDPIANAEPCIVQTAPPVALADSS